MKTVQVNEADPRVKRTRKLLQDAFLALLAEKSFQAISVRDVAERATVNRATFYGHFVDKYDILDQVVGERFRDVLTGRVSAASPFNLEDLRVLIVAVLESLAEFDDHCRRAVRGLDLPVQTKMQQELWKFLMGWLEAHQPAEAEQRAGRDTAATIMSWTIFGAGIEWSRGAREISAGERARQIVGLFNGGLERMAIMPSPAARERQR